MKKIEELERRIAELEAELRGLKARPAEIHHHHPMPYPYPVAIPMPQAIPAPWVPNVWCGEPTTIVGYVNPAPNAAAGVPQTFCVGVN
jgi:hypothetical protein